MKILVSVVIMVAILFSVSHHAYAGEFQQALRDGGSISTVITVQDSGQYNLLFTYKPLSAFINPAFVIEVNGRTQRIVAPILWQYQSFDFIRNRNGHEQLPQPHAVDGWHTSRMYYPDFLETRAVLFELYPGENIITITHLSGEVLFESVAAIAPVILRTYQEYMDMHALVPRGTASQITVQAQKPTRFNSSSIRLVSTNSPEATPYSSRYMLLNTLGGGAWSESGQSVTYQFYVEEAGMYNISLHAQQAVQGESVFRTLLVNGELPFMEMEAYSIPSARRLAPHTFADEDGTPFLFYFHAGYNEITLVATSAPVEDVIHTLAGIRDEIRFLSLDIRRLTGNRVDLNRDWQIEEFIPDVRDMFDSWVAQLEDVRSYMTKLNASDRRSTTIVELDHVIRRLTQLGENPNDIPFRMSELAEGAASAAVILAGLEESLAFQPLLLNQIIVHGEDVVFPARSGFFRRLQSFFAQFFASFTARRAVVDDNALEVWVSHSQLHLELLQHLTDTMFTAETGIQVNMTLMPNDTNLILANAGGRAPDVAVGISAHLPFQMAIRGAAADLTQFDGFTDIAGRFNAGSFLPVMYDDGVFALPETQDFYVLFYRTDLMQEFGLAVPDTWFDVIGMLPTLQRRGANFFIPMSGPAAHKPFMFTAPFVYQFGADFHSPDGLSTAINSHQGVEALTFLTDLYTLYGLPLQVANFYNDFRYGTVPIGVSNLATYIMLTTAAPEIAGAWNIAMHPGMPAYGDSDDIVRWASGSAQMSMMMAQSTRQEEAFQFLEWWTRTQTQTTFANNLMLIHGQSFLWSSANAEAFANLPLPREHMDVILAQREFVRDVPLTPAAYIIEREVSNIWNRVVFDGDNLRVATDRAVNTINREIRRRMEEFGYVSQGEVIRYYNLPTLERARELGGR